MSRWLIKHEHFLFCIDMQLLNHISIARIRLEELIKRIADTNDDSDCRSQPTNCT